MPFVADPPEVNNVDSEQLRNGMVLGSFPLKKSEPIVEPEEFMVERMPPITVTPYKPATYSRWGIVGSATARVSPIIRQWLKQEYNFRDSPPDEVLGFIEQYPFLATLLIDTYFEVRKYFPDGRIYLEVMAEPDSDSQDDIHLTAYVETKLNPAEAVRKLRDFDRAWWLNALPRAQGRLSIDVEFP